MTLWQLNPGQNTHARSGVNHVFVNYAQPTFQTASYYFSTPDPEDDYQTYSPPIPSEPSFTPTNITPLLIASVGQSYSLSGWARKIITNGNTNKPAYLEQFFDKAFKADAIGNATTNQTGVLSEFGEFFPTEPGRTLLTTKPDIETSEIGSAVVNVISLNVDANHDGTMDRSFTGPDTTSAGRPFRFWVNNDSDVGGADLASPSPANHLDNRINGERDLEDFARLWISGLPKLPTASGYTLTLSLLASAGSPSINLFAAHDTNGSAAYLTDTNAAAAQFTQEFLNGQVAFDYALRVGQVSASQSYTVPVFTDGTPQFTRFLFEGTGAGSGQLVLTVSNSTTLLAQTAVWIELLDIRDMYERVYAENVSQQLPPSDLLSLHRVANRLAPAVDETKHAIVFVHGTNNKESEYESTSATFFKRLYWSGYRGRVASFRWPCLLLPNCELAVPFGYRNFNPSEFIAWKSARALRDYMLALQARPGLDGYSLNIIAHSQGNIVASEAILQGAPFDHYILTQGAVPAHSYDPAVTNLQSLVSAEQQEATPYTAALGGYHDYFAGINGDVINFYNPDDFALVRGICSILGANLDTNWEKGQAATKPELTSGGDYRFNGTNCTIERTGGAGTVITPVTDPMEKKAMVARSRTKAVGAQAGMGGVVASSVDLHSTFGFSDTRPEHSAQFTRNLQSVWRYYDQTIISFGMQLHVTR